MPIQVEKKEHKKRGKPKTDTDCATQANHPRERESKVREPANQTAQSPFEQKNKKKIG